MREIYREDTYLSDKVLADQRSRTRREKDGRGEGWGERGSLLGGLDQIVNVAIVYLSWVKDGLAFMIVLGPTIVQNTNNIFLISN